MIKDSSIKIRLTNDERLKVKEIAKSKGMTLSDLVREVLNKEFGNKFKISIDKKGDIKIWNIKY